MASAFDKALAALPMSYPGPGGAVAVVQAGRAIVRHAWGWADNARRIPFTPATLYRICSITKQFVCGTMLERCAEPSVLDPLLRAAMPLLGNRAPTALQLAHNQSGLRDYWAMAMLCGAPVEGVFTEDDAQRMIGATASLQFVPGTRYSYCNQNFRLLGNALEDYTGEDLATLLRESVLERAGMATARLWPDTSAMPDGTQGYEGSLATGFRQAVNRVHWTGDAGLIASLDDMIAWERFIDATRDDADGLYSRLSAPVSFADGTPARYGFGLQRLAMQGRAATAHGGGLRGWCSYRVHLPAERLSVVVLFNHMNDPRIAAASLIGALLGPDAAPPPSASASAPQHVDPALLGTYLEPETGLLARVEYSPAGRLQFCFGSSPEPLTPTAEGAEGGASTLALAEGGVALRRPMDNLTTTLRKIVAPAEQPPTGRFRGAEWDAEFTCVETEGVVYGAFTGFLGQGEMRLMLPAGGDFWRMPMPRALDHAAPGDWTVEALRNGHGEIVSVEIGCWLARRVVFDRVA
jgi:D-aminopeptidase